jgi:MFS family permease
MQPSSHPDVIKNLRHNFVVNVLDSTFFGGGMGFTSQAVILPLFLSTLTDSTTLIALIASVGQIGWQLPQILTARRVAALPQYKSLTLRISIHERVPFFPLAVMGLLVTRLSPGIAVALTFLFIIWHAIGGGLTATPWQSLMGRVIPEKIRGTFYGVQSAGFTMLSAICAFIAGYLVTDVPYPLNYAACFFLTTIMVMISWTFLSLTREPVMPPPPVSDSKVPFRRELLALLKRDARLRWYVLARGMGQFAGMAAGLYTIYAVRQFKLQPDTIGAMGALMLVAGAFANVAGGWLGDRIGHTVTFALGILSFGAANVLALAAPDPNWLVLTYVLAGAAGSLIFTSVLTLTLTFGQPHERPLYIGLANTLVAPFTLLAPVTAGMLVDTFDFPVMFGVTLVCMVIALLCAVQMRIRVKSDAPGDEAAS